MRANGATPTPPILRRFIFCCVLWVTAGAISTTGILRAQSPELPSPRLDSLVEAYLEEANERRAAQHLKSIRGLRPSSENLLKILRTPPPPFPEKFKFRVPFEGKEVEIQVEVPPGHGLKSPPLPVVLQFRLARIPDTVRVPGVINAWPLRFDAEAGSESLRNAAVKFLNAVAWRARGDTRALWLSGFSIGGHAVVDAALRRPHCFRGIIPMAGTLSRRDFRLLGNLEGHSVFAMCGEKDDRELIWNLKELQRRAPQFGFDYQLGLDPQVPGRLIPSPRYVPKIAPHLERFGRASAAMSPKGHLAADARGIRSPYFEVLAVETKRIKAPRRIPVPARLSADEQRRHMIDAVIDRRAELHWTWSGDSQDKGGPLLSLRSEGVTRAKLRLRPSLLGDRVTFRLKLGEKRPPRLIRLKPKVAVILEDVRATGRRLDPCLQEQSLRF
jgi:pimeloyl-ACP methyl ester carboxylesterase